MTNLVMLAVDDLFNYVRYRDHFGVTVSTPNLDRLAEKGAFFSQAFATTPLCSPSRSTILTGQSLFETRVFMNSDPWPQLIAPEETLPAAYVAAGYRTGLFGKVFHGAQVPEEYAERIADLSPRPEGIACNDFG